MRRAVTNLVYRLRKRAEIRRQIPTRKSVQEGEPDRIADLLEEAANALEKQWVPLTEEEKHKAWVMDFDDAFKYIECKLKEKNT